MRLPGIVLGAVALPLYSELFVSSLPSDSQDLIHIVELPSPALSCVDFRPVRVVEDPVAARVAALMLANLFSLFGRNHSDLTLGAHVHCLGFVDRCYHIGVFTGSLRDGRDALCCRRQTVVQERCIIGIPKGITR